MLYWVFQEGTPKVLVGAWEPNLVNHQLITLYIYVYSIVECFKPKNVISPSQISKMDLNIQKFHTKPYGEEDNCDCVVIIGLSI